MKIFYDKKRDLVNGKIEETETMLTCSYAYNEKEILKSHGFMFNRLYKTWVKFIDDEEFVETTLKIAMDCKMKYEDVMDCMEKFPEYLFEYAVSDDTMSAWNEYIGE